VLEQRAQARYPTAMSKQTVNSAYRHHVAMHKYISVNNALKGF
jgi:hypothetical protein